MNQRLACIVTAISDFPGPLDHLWSSPPLEPYCVPERVSQTHQFSPTILLAHPDSSGWREDSPTLLLALQCPLGGGRNVCYFDAVLQFHFWASLSTVVFYIFTSKCPLQKIAFL